MSFAAATKVQPAGDARWTAEIEPGWEISGISNGGYLMAITARAMAGAAPGRELVSISSHFLNPGRPGPVTVEVEKMKAGRSITTIRADLKGPEKPLLTAIASFADPDRPTSPARLMQSTAPRIPPPEQCLRAIHDPNSAFPPPFVDKVQMMLHPEDASSLDGRTSGVAHVRGWLRPLDDEAADSFVVVMASDGLPPAIFTTDLPKGWTPTLDLTVHIRDSKPRTWLQLDVRTRFVTGGLLEEDVDIWDEDGKLVAHSRQLALVSL